MALRSLMMVALTKEIRQLQVFRDSQPEINWLNYSQQIHNVALQPSALQVKENASQFKVINFTHIYRELNMDADSLSKQGPPQDPGFLWLEEHVNGVINETRVDL